MYCNPDTTVISVKTILIFDKVNTWMYRTLNYIEERAGCGSTLGHFLS